MPVNTAQSRRSSASPQFYANGAGGHTPSCDDEASRSDGRLSSDVTLQRSPPSRFSQNSYDSISVGQDLKTLRQHTPSFLQHLPPTDVDEDLMDTGRNGGRILGDGGVAATIGAHEDASRMRRASRDQVYDFDEPDEVEPLPRLQSGYFSENHANKIKTGYNNVNGNEQYRDETEAPFDTPVDGYVRDIGNENHDAADRVINADKVQPNESANNWSREAAQYKKRLSLKFDRETRLSSEDRQAASGILHTTESNITTKEWTTNEMEQVEWKSQTNATVAEVMRTDSKSSSSSNEEFVDSPLSDGSYTTTSQMDIHRRQKENSPERKYGEDVESTRYGNIDPLAAMLQRFSIPSSSSGLPFLSSSMSMSSFSHPSRPFSFNTAYTSPPHRPPPHHQTPPPPPPYFSRSSHPSSIDRDIFNIPHSMSTLSNERFPGGSVYSVNSTLSPRFEGVRDNKFYCHICSFVGTSEENFKDHLKCHFEHPCPHCTYSSRTQGRLKRHIADFHSDKLPDFTDLSRKIVGAKPKLLKCRQCRYATTVREEFWAHSRVHIKKEKQLSCPRCEFVTEFKHHLEYHIRNHVGSKPYKCNKCTYTCVNKSMLNSHLKSHTNVYRYRCASCTYATKYAHSLKIHLRKKKHTAAVVLNEDGSLPIDGMGNFDVLAKRGPPKGSRVSKKTVQAASGSAGSSPEQFSSLSSQFPNNLQHPDSGVNEAWSKQQMFPNLSFHSSPDQSIRHNGAERNTPVKDTSVYSSPQNILHELANNTDLPLSVLSSTFLPPRSVFPASLSSPMRCRLCRLNCSSLSHLAQHFMQEHTGEGHEILASFGIKPETLSALTWPSSAMKEELRKLSDRLNATQQPFSNHPLPSSHSRQPAECDADGTHFALPLGKVDYGNVADEEKSSKSGEFVIRNGMSHSDVNKSEARVTVERPLDLSSKLECEKYIQRKKRSSEDDITADDNDADDSPASVPSASGSPSVGLSPTVRRRSRKGKACKIDLLNVKNEDRWECDDDDDDEVRNRSDFRSRAVDPYSVSGSTAHTDRMTEVAGDKLSLENCFGKLEEKKFELIGQAAVSDTSEVEKSIARQCAVDSGFFMCHHCEIGFRDRITHSIHMGYHGFSDPFKCNMCGDRSKDRVEFFIHMARVAHE